MKSAGLGIGLSGPRSAWPAARPPGGGGGLSKPPGPMGPMPGGSRAGRTAPRSPSYSLVVSGGGGMGGSGGFAKGGSVGLGADVKPRTRKTGAK